ncbi:acyl-CoA dehydrogenase [Pseudonocardia sp. NPDC049154]|uniref:acyl-CoA dehydrogenase n=1 Tax=Pseudonocardia sp. NPDC049154 TaxID=3155501 RepID=UPI0033F9C46B
MTRSVFVTNADDEERALREAVAAVLTRRPDPTADVLDTTTWSALARDIGVAGLAVPEAFGGAGAGWRELGAVFEELGAGLAAVPLLPTILAAEVLLAADDGQAAAHLPRIAAGESTGTVALGTTDRVWADGDLLHGECAQVLDGATADLLLVTAVADGGATLFAVAGSAPGLEQRPLPTLDPSRPQAVLRLDGAPGTRVGPVGAAPAMLDRARARAAVALACEALGVASRSLRTAVGYAAERRQFGRLIGSYQSVKHLLATLVTEVESTRSLARHAAALAAADDPEAATVAALAVASCTESAVRVAEGTIQVLGGIGMTWEHPAHRYLKRAKTNELLLGSPATRRAWAAPRIGSETLVARPAAREQTQSADAVRLDLAERVKALVAQVPDPEAEGGIPFRAAQFDAGLAWVHFPAGHGGLGLSAEHQGYAQRLLEEAGVVWASPRNPIGYGNVGPVLAEHGTEEQRRAYLKRCFTVEDVWAQLMSEPGAGSDVAGLATRAVRDGDGWRVTGQKVWTSFAHIARYGLLVARTDPAVPKHEGITCFVIDMRAPGVEVRPLRLLTGKADFNEVFLTDVVLRDSARVGPVGGGWRVVRSNLEGERMAFGQAAVDRTPELELLRHWRFRAGDRDPVLTDGVLSALSWSYAARLTVLRAEAGEPVHPAVIKLLSTESRQACAAAALEVEGAAGTLTEVDAYRFEQPDRAGMAGGPGSRYLRSQGLTIEGGTSMVMRNAVAEQVLGLPREHRVDVGIPWREVPRSGA